jgi:hypothetical protein
MKWNGMESVESINRNKSKHIHQTEVRPRPRIKIKDEVFFWLVYAHKNAMMMKFLFQKGKE